jgi:integrase
MMSRQSTNGAKLSRPSKPASKKAGRVVRRKLADGTVREYRYKPYRQKPSPRLERDSLASLIVAWKGSPAWREFAPKTVEYYCQYLRPLDAIGHNKVAELTRRHIIEIRDAIAKHRGNGAANAFVRSVSALFAWAVSSDWIAQSPVYKIKRLPGGSLPAWTPEAAVAALAGLPEHYRRVVVLGLLTGQRRGDLIAMRWSDYDGERISVTQQKTGAGLSLAVHPDLKAELDAWPREAATILMNSFGRPFEARSLTVNLPRAMAKLGVPKGMNVHGLRKLFAAGMADAGATTHEIAAHTGHKTLSMIQHYTVTADQRKLATGSVDKIKTWTNGQQSLDIKRK